MDTSPTRYLIYCICTARPAPATEVLAGVDLQPVFLIDRYGLAAAVSRHPGGPGCLAPDTARGLAYGRVVDALHQQDTVLPLRYGCVMNDARGVAELLESRASDYRTALRELDGCVEMGLRILLDQPASVPVSPRPPGATAGTSYLLARKRHYEDDERTCRTALEACEKYRSTFSRFVVECREEGSAGADTTRPVCGASLDFLVKRENVEPLRQAFRELCRAEPARLLLTGPWPPYSFAERPRP